MRRGVMSIAIGCVALAGCYLSHELTPFDRPAVDAGPRDLGVPPDLGADAPTCTRPDVSVSFLGTSCEGSPTICPAGYACVPVSGAALVHLCEIPCMSDCDCPETASCRPFTDKAGTRLFCAVPVILF